MDIDDAPVGLNNAEAWAWVRGYEACAEKVLALWNRGNGWIPGSAHAELAEVLGIAGDETLEARRSRPSYTEPPGSY